MEEKEELLRNLAKIAHLICLVLLAYSTLVESVKKDDEVLGKMRHSASNASTLGRKVSAAPKMRKNDYLTFAGSPKNKDAACILLDDLQPHRVRNRKNAGVCYVSLHSFLF